MRYAESRRAVGVLAVLVALALLMIAGAFIGRRTASAGDNAGAYGRFDAWRASLIRQPGTTNTIQKGAGGVTKSVVENISKHIRVETVVNGQDVSIIISAPFSERAHIASILDITGRATYWEQRDGLEYITNNAADVIDMRVVAGVGMAVALIVATLLGGPLAKENDGHLALVWTRPISRLRYVLSAVGIDIAAIVLGEALAAFAFAVVVVFYSANTRIVGSEYSWAIPATFLIPIAWYALVTAVSASLRRGLAVVLGATWAVAFGVLILARMNTGWHTLQAFNALNPLHYLDDAGSSGALRYAIALAVLTVVYIGVAVIQWQRAEV